MASHPDRRTSASACTASRRFFLRSKRLMESSTASVGDTRATPTPASAAAAAAYNDE